MSQVTLDDIARKTGVSKAAVAKVILNNRSNVRVGREKTDLIRKVAAEMGYRPNTIAQSLRSGRSHMIGVVTGGLESPYFSEILEHAERVAAEHGFQVLIVPVQWGSERELNAVDTLYGNRVDGIFLSTGLYERNPDALKKYEGIPIVPEPGMSDILMDYHTGMQELFDALVQSEVESLSFLTNSEVAEKETAYLACCKAYSIPAEILRFESKTSGSLEESVDRIVRRKIRNILVCSDHYAMLLIHALGERNVRVPEDVRVVSIGGTKAGRFYNPSLASISQKIREFSEAKLQMLFDRIQGSKTPCFITIKTTFLPGRSFPLVEKRETRPNTDGFPLSKKKKIQK